MNDRDMQPSYEHSYYPKGMPVQETTMQPTIRRCLVADCNCKDARILSTRNMRFVQARRPDAQPTRDPSTLTLVSLTA